MNRLIFIYNSRLASIYQCSKTHCFAKSTTLLVVICLIGISYLMMAFSIFHSLWYHKLFCIISALMFAYSMQELYFERLEKKVKQGLPKTTKKLSHYYTHYKGNVILTIKETEERCPQDVRHYLIKIRKALSSGTPGEEIEILKTTFPFVWFRMLASILFMAKEKGMGVEEEAGQHNLIGKSLIKMTNILSFINVQQGYNDADLSYIQLFLYMAPFLFIFAADWVNARILVEMNMQDVYQGVKAQNLKAYIFLASNLSALFVHWMRKQQI